MKRALQVIAVVVTVLVVAVGSVWYRAFASNSDIVDAKLVAPGVETVKDGFVAAYVVDAGAGKVVLIDAGKDRSAAAIQAALARRGLGPTAVSAIFLTHGHGDHIAGCKAFPGATVYALDGDSSLVREAADTMTAVHDGEVVQVGDARIETFAVPGHTPGSAVYLARGVLFFGDSAGASKEGVMMKAVSLFSKSSSENVSSLKALAARLASRSDEVKHLAFGHTGPLDGLVPLTAFASGH